MIEAKAEVEFHVKAVDGPWISRSSFFIRAALGALTAEKLK